MDKYETVLDIIEHSSKYSPEELQAILSDPETRELYATLCKADSAIEAEKEIDMDAEWENFSQKIADRPPHRLFAWFGSRAASIAAIICTSIVAIAAGIAVTVTITERMAAPKVQTEVIKESPTLSENETNTIAPTDTVNVNLAPIMFEDKDLETIMNRVAERYGVEVRFNDKEVASLHLYYKLDPALPLDEVVAQLNTFELINITRNGNILTID